MGKFIAAAELLIQPVHSFLQTVIGIPGPALLLHKCVGNFCLQTGFHHTGPVGVTLSGRHQSIAQGILKVYHTDAFSVTPDEARHIPAVSVQMVQIQTDFQFRHVFQKIFHRIYFRNCGKVSGNRMEAKLLAQRRQLLLHSAQFCDIFIQAFRGFQTLRDPADTEPGAAGGGVQPGVIIQVLQNQIIKILNRNRGNLVIPQSLGDGFCGYSRSDPLQLNGFAAEFVQPGECFRNLFGGLQKRFQTGNLNSV